MRLRTCHAHALLVLSFLVFLDTPLEAQQSGYYTHPTIHGDQVIFVSEGDLFSAVLSNKNEQGSTLAHRLTSSDGSESDPVLSWKLRHLLLLVVSPLRIPHSPLLEQ